MRWSFGPPHLNLNLPKPKPKSPPPQKVKQASYQKCLFWPCRKFLKPAKLEKILLNRHFSKPQKAELWTNNTCAYFWEIFAYFPFVAVSSLFLAKLCLGGHNILKPYFIAFVAFKKLVCVFVENWFLSPLLKKGLFRKVADNRLQAPKHRTLSFAQKMPETTIKTG